ncbi:MAG: RIP metalloprotease RseP [Planctomycetaceae bacterium]|nr:RIP metalloprotease RseP [Planctomycetaceae bacterium]
MVILAAVTLGSLLNIIYVAIGLGLVIFFHELGHFAMAKWCNVNVERFSIGFGPVLWSRKHGETEYALSAIPFGGYVKMLGQDDMDPSQLTQEEIAQDPRSYSAKPVHQRMAIISAGVTMNVLTAVIFYAVAFGMGVTAPPPVVGTVQVGSPAWMADIQSGDTIRRINDRETETFMDVYRAVLLSSDELEIEGTRLNGETWTARVMPDQDGSRRSIGISPTRSLTVATLADPENEPTQAGMSAREAGFESGDVVLDVDGEPVSSFAELQDKLSGRRSETVSVTVERNGSRKTLQVAPNHMITLGLSMDVGRISAVRTNSPAAEAGLKQGDKITRVNDRGIGIDLDPLRLPDLLAELHGQEVSITVSRPVKGANPETVTVRLVPENRAGWLEPIASGSDGALPLPAIGVAAEITRTVLHVEEGSPAEGKIEPGERIQKMVLTLPEGVPSDGFNNGKPIVLDFTREGDAREASNWAYAYYMMQQARLRNVQLTVSNDGEARTVDLKPAVAEDWYIATRGLGLEPMMVVQKAKSVGNAFVLGYHSTRNNILDIYLTLRNLVSGALSYRELHGPIGIATVAYKVASQGMAQLLLFLGFLSVNLAVLNFLPIPVLDGGHMVFLLWEAITRKRPSERVLAAATYCGMAFVLGLMLLVIYLDIFEHGLGGP